MSFVASLRGVFGGNNGAAEVHRALKSIYAGFSLRSAALEATAASAPTEAVAADLRSLAEVHRATGGLIRQALEEHNFSVPGEPASGEPSPGRSHWARVVADLGRFQEARNEVLDTAARLGERHPDLVPLLDGLTRALDDHITRVRAEIARADPQALN